LWPFGQKVRRLAGRVPLVLKFKKHNKIKILTSPIPPCSPLTWWSKSGMSRRDCLGMQPNIKAKAIKQEYPLLGSTDPLGFAQKKQ
jgi:hypothetical protein